MQRGTGAAPGGLLRTAEAVEDLQLRRGQREPAVLVLAVERQQRAARLAQVGRGGAAAAEVGARAALGAHPAGEHELLGVGGEPVAERRAHRLGQREDALDVGLGRARAHDARPRLAAEQQVERVGEHGLAGARLPREHVEPRAERELGPFDQQQVLDAELVQHRRRSTSRRRRIGPVRVLRHEVVTKSCGRLLRQAPEALAQPVVERRARQLGEQAVLLAELHLRRPRPRPISHAGRPSTWTSTGSSRLRLEIVSTSPGATTSARAVSECGAMKETTKPSTPQAITGPPLARL